MTISMGSKCILGFLLIALRMQTVRGNDFETFRHVYYSQKEFARGYGIVLHLFYTTQYNELTSSHKNLKLLKSDSIGVAICTTSVFHDGLIQRVAEAHELGEEQTSPPLVGDAFGKELKKNMNSLVNRLSVKIRSGFQQGMNMSTKLLEVDTDPYISMPDVLTAANVGWAINHSDVPEYNEGLQKMSWKFGIYQTEFQQFLKDDAKNRTFYSLAQGGFIYLRNVLVLEPNVEILGWKELKNLFDYPLPLNPLPPDVRTKIVRDSQQDFMYYYNYPEERRAKYSGIAAKAWKYFVPVARTQCPSYLKIRSILGVTAEGAALNVLEAGNNQVRWKDVTDCFDSIKKPQLETFMQGYKRRFPSSDALKTTATILFDYPPLCTRLAHLAKLPWGNAMSTPPHAGNQGSFISLIAPVGWDHASFWLIAGSVPKCPPVHRIDSAKTNTKDEVIEELNYFLANQSSYAKALPVSSPQERARNPRKSGLHVNLYIALSIVALLSALPVISLGLFTYQLRAWNSA